MRLTIAAMLTVAYIVVASFNGQSPSMPVGRFAGNGVPSMVCVAGQEYYQADALAGRRIWMGVGSPCVWEVQGNNTVSFVSYKAAVCQNTTASLGFSLPTTNPAVAACVTGTNTQYGVAQFANGANALSVQDHFPIPLDQAGDIDAAVKWRTVAVAGSVVWQLGTACVADGETGDPAWNTPSVFATDSAKGTANQFNDALRTAIDLTGCGPGAEFFFRFFRDPAHASDTLEATAELISLTFKIRRLM